MWYNDRMIISNKKKFIFASVPKTGTTSIERTLMKYEDAFATVRSKKHAPFSQVNHLYIPYFKFCFFRNPWDQFVSLYEYRKERRKFEEASPLPAFDEWVEGTVLCWEYNIETEYGFLLDTTGFPIPDIKVYKYEDIYGAWGDICKRLNITDKLPHYNYTKHRHYSTYYTNKTRHIIARKCWREIEMMNYEFEEKQ